MELSFLTYRHENFGVESFQCCGINYIYPQGSGIKELMLWNLARELTYAELMPYIKSVDFTSTHCKVNTTEECDCIDDFERTYIYNDKREVIDLFLRNSGMSYVSTVSGRKETGYSNETRDLIRAVKRLSFDDAMQALNRKANPNAILAEEVAGIIYPSVLMATVLFKRADIAKILLAAGADPNGQHLESPLSVAYAGGIEGKEIVKLLLSYRATDLPDKRDRWLKRCSLNFDDIKPRRLISKENPESTRKRRKIPATNES